MHKAKVLAKLPNLIKPRFVLLSTPKRHKPTAAPLASFFIFRFSMLLVPPNNERSVAISHHHVTALMDLNRFISDYLNEAWFVELRWSFRHIV